MKLSILIPVYNDKDYIAKTIQQIKAVHFPIPYEIVAVDDASTDGSKEILEKIPNIIKIFHKNNTGKGGAIMTGLQHVTGDIIAIQDDDCEYDPAAIPKLIEPIIQDTSDVVYGSRFLQKNSMFFIQKMENLAITLLANILLGHNLSDIETGHKVFSKKFADKITLTKKGFEFDMEITLQFIKHKARIQELPTTYAARTHAQGKKITYKDGIRSIATLFRFTLKERIQKMLLGVVFISVVFLPRVIGLGHMLTVDEPLWLSRGKTFINGFSVGDFGKTLVAGQPGVTTAWLSGLSAPWHSLFAGQLAIAIASSALVLIIWYFLTILLGKKWGTITGLFLALDPFLIAHSRVVHTDALLALFYLASITSLMCAFASKTFQKRYVVYSAILAAFALLTKIFGVVVIPTVCFIIFYNAWIKKYRWTAVVQILGIWLSVFALCTFIAWPALWTDSEKVYNLLTSRASIHAEGTRTEETTSFAWYYARELFFRSSVPVALLMPFALWQLISRRYPKHATVAATLFLSGVIFALILNNSSDKSDRYVLFCHIALVAAAPLGLRALADNLLLKKWALAIIIVPLAFSVIDVSRLHPYYLAHYNRLYKIESDHKLGWGEGLEQAAQWIEATHPNAKVLSFYPRVFSYFYSGEVESITHVNDAPGDFAVLYRSMFERGDNASETEILREFFSANHAKPAHVITVNGIPYVWIFKL